MRTACAPLAVAAAAAALAACGDGGSGSGTTRFVETDLVSDQAGRAAVTDPNLVNAWGIALGPATPFWISDNGPGVSTLYDGAGTPFPVGSPLVVTVPPPPDSAPGAGAAPTGIVFNGTSDFVITEGSTSAPALFVFDTEEGTLAGWSPSVDVTTAILTVDQSGSEAIYKGLAIATNASGPFLFATNFSHGTVDVFDKNFAPATLAGAFSDPDIPAGFAPFGIQELGGRLYVTYAKQDEDKEDDVPGAGNGFVDVFDTNGSRLRRVASGEPLNSPWGLALAPASFGSFAGALLVGNFGDGRINAFNATSGQLLGPLSDTAGSPVTISGLWGLIVGNGAMGGDSSTLYFTAGPGDEQHGLFGALRPQMG